MAERPGGPSNANKRSSRSLLLSVASRQILNAAAAGIYMTSTKHRARSSVARPADTKARLAKEKKESIGSKSNCSFWRAVLKKRFVWGCGQVKPRRDKQMPHYEVAQRLTEHKRQALKRR